MSWVHYKLSKMICTTNNHTVLEKRRYAQIWIEQINHHFKQSELDADMLWKVNYILKILSKIAHREANDLLDISIYTSYLRELLEKDPDYIEIHKVLKNSSDITTLTGKSLEEIYANIHTEKPVTNRQKQAI